MLPLKNYQREAVEKTIEIFRYANRQLNDASDEVSRAIEFGAG